MPVKLRLILFYFFVILFFVLSPIFMFYSLGYRMNFKTFRLERLGMISIRTLPDEAAIQLNGKIQRQKSPARMANLLPGKYLVQISKNECRPWMGEVQVKANWVTRLESIILFPKKIEFVPVTEFVVQKFFVSPKSRKMIFLGESEDERGLWLLDMLLEEETLILDERQLDAYGLKSAFMAGDAGIHWSKDERAVVIEKDGQFFLLDLKKPNRITALKDLMGFEPDQIAWSDRTAGSFFYRFQGGIGKYFFRRKKTEANLLTDAGTFHYQDGFIYYIEKKDGMIWRWSEDFLEKIPMVQIPEFDPEARYEIIVNPLGDLLAHKLQVDVLKDQNVFYELNTSKKFEGIHAAIWEKSGKGLLLTGKQKCIFMQESSSKVKDENVSQPEEIMIPQEIKNIFWFDSTKLMLLSRRKAFLRQLGVESESYTQEIFSFSPGGKEAYWDARFKQLYLIEALAGQTGGKLIRYNLAQGPLSKLMQNVRETMSDGIQLLYEVRKNND